MMLRHRTSFAIHSDLMPYASPDGTKQSLLSRNIGVQPAFSGVITRRTDMADKDVGGKPGRREGNLDIQDKDVTPIESEAALKGDDGDDVEGDDVMSVAARREAARLKGDVFLVRSDLEDADQREATPGVREQD